MKYMYIKVSARVSAESSIYLQRVSLNHIIISIFAYSYTRARTMSCWQRARYAGSMAYAHTLFLRRFSLRRISVETKCGLEKSKNSLYLHVPLMYRVLFNPLVLILNRVRLIRDPFGTSRIYVLSYTISKNCEFGSCLFRSNCSYKHIYIYV